MFDVLGLLFGFAHTPTLPAVTAFEVPAAPTRIGQSVAPIVDAKAALVFDVKSGVTLFAQSADEHRAIGSLTKLATALVTRDAFKLDDVVTISKNAASQPPAKAWLRAGEQMTVGELLKCLLIASANDAAVALAEHYPGGATQFVAAMNAKVRTLDLRDTHFTNPAGLDDVGNYATARDIARLARAFERDVVLAQIAASANGAATSVDGKVTHSLVSTNNLFGSYLDIRGLKTGTTDEAGDCLAALSRNSRGADILAVVLNSPNRWQEAKILLEWADEAHAW